MKTIRGILFDIGGVLYVGDRVIEGAPQTIALLQRDYPIRFLTNTTRRTPETVLHKLRHMGFSVTPETLFTALDAAKRYIQEREGTLYPLLTDEATAWFSDYRSDKPDFVLVGDAWHNFDYTHLNTAFRALKEGAKLLAAAKNRYFLDNDGKLSMDAGGFIAALEYAAETEAEIIGKPSKAFFHLAVDSMGLKPDEVLMVGDDITSDIAGAQAAGLRAALVKTGKFSESDLDKGITPDVVLPDVTALPTVLL